MVWSRSDHAEWERSLGRACSAARNDDVRALLSQETLQTEQRNQGIRLALRRATETSKNQSTAMLLLNEFAPAASLSALFFLEIFLRAVDRNMHLVVKELLSQDAPTKINHVRWRTRRTPLFCAAVKGHVDICVVLLNAGADVNTKAARDQTLLTFLAAEPGPEKPRTARIVELLLQSHASVSENDSTGKNALHWAAATGKAETVRLLLTTDLDVNASSDQNRTALHYAAGGLNLDHSDRIVDMLLHAGADHSRKGDGYWTALHFAARGGNLNAVKRLLIAGADVNATLANGITASHIAAGHGQKPVIEYLLSVENIHRHPKDAFGLTPLMRAAQNSHSEIASLFQLQSDWDSLSTEQKSACRCEEFSATLIDFDASPILREVKMSRVKRVKMRELLYSESPKIKAEPPPRDRIKRFRWIHIPANNVAWMEALLNKFYIEAGTTFSPAETKNLRWTFETLNQEHRGRHVYSTYMIPKCSHIGATTKISHTPEEEHQLSTSDSVPPRSRSKDKIRPRPMETITSKSLCGNIALFMPYLDFEIHERHTHMAKILRLVRDSDGLCAPLLASRDFVADVRLISAYLNSSSVLHPRRTLDQYLYHNFDTQVRDSDQVVCRYFKQLKQPPKLYMVDQLWLWTLGDGLTVTSFPERWGQHRQQSDPLRTIDGIIEELNIRTEPLKTVYDLAMAIAGRCAGDFGRHRLAETNYQFLDIFDARVGDICIQEPILFDRFNKASTEAAALLSLSRTSHDMRALSNPMFANDMLDIKQEMKCLKELKDIRDEINIISLIFQQQEDILLRLEEAIISQEECTAPAKAFSLLHAQIQHVNPASPIC